MSTFPESSLIAAGFLRRRCCEPVNMECPACGTTLLGFSLSDCANGVECGTCGQRTPQPRLKCARCKELLPSVQKDTERDCMSIEAYRKGNCAAVFAPEEPLWVFKRSEHGPVEAAAESELKRRFSDGELDTTVLMRSVNQARYVRADACPEFRDVARARPIRPARTTPAPAVPDSDSATASMPVASARPVVAASMTDHDPLIPTVRSPKSNLFIRAILSLALAAGIYLLGVKLTSVSFRVCSQNGHLFDKGEYVSSIVSGDSFIWPGTKTLNVFSDYFTPCKTNIHIRWGRRNNLGTIPVEMQAVQFNALDFSISNKNDLAIATWLGLPVVSGMPVKSGAGEFAVSLENHLPFRTNIIILPGQIINLGDIHLQPMLTTISMISSVLNARFQLVGPQEFSGNGSATFSNVICGSYKVIATVGGDDYQFTIEATSKTPLSVEYLRELSIQLHSRENLAIYYRGKYVGGKTGTIIAPAGEIVINLRGKGSVDLVDLTGRGLGAIDVDWNTEVPIKMSEGGRMASIKGWLVGFGYGIGKIGGSDKQKYEMTVEQTK